MLNVNPFTDNSVPFQRELATDPPDANSAARFPSDEGDAKIRSAPVEPMRILVAENDKKIASFIQKGLQQEGHAADVVHDGKDASHQALSFDYDLVILDLMLPGRPGLDVLRDIRSQKPRLPL